MMLTIGTEAICTKHDHINHDIDGRLIATSARELLQEQVSVTRESGGNGSGGCGNTSRGGQGKCRGNSCTNANTTAKQEPCAALGKSAFDYGHKAAADEMQTSWEKIVQCVGATCGQDISNELQNKGHVTVTKPQHSVAVMQWHTAR